MVNTAELLKAAMIGLNAVADAEDWKQKKRGPQTLEHLQLQERGRRAMRERHPPRSRKRKEHRAEGEASPS